MAKVSIPEESGAIDYENWMSNLPADVASRPIHALAIPGSHDSFSYTLSEKSEIAPDDDNLTFINKLPSCVRNIVKRTIYRWSLTQHLGCSEQLTSGVRYFDLRVAPDDHTGEVRLVHGLYGCSIHEALGPILEFVRNHPKEVVFLDFQHFYKFTEEVHAKLISIIVELFGSLLCPFTPKLEPVTLSWLWSKGYQVFVFYRFSCHLHANIWPSASIPTPWPNTIKPREMIKFLDANYHRGRPFDKFYVTQGVLTPDTALVLLHPLSTLEGMLVGKANSAIFTWMKDKMAGENGINIVISDFVGSSPNIEQEVINLNYPLEIRKLKEKLNGSTAVQHEK